MSEKRLQGVSSQATSSKRYAQGIRKGIFQQAGPFLIQLIRNTRTQFSSQNSVFTQCTFLKEIYSFILHMAIEHRYYTTKTKAHALLSFQTIVGSEKVRRSRKAKETSR